MTLSTIIWRCIFILLNFSIQRYPLIPVDCLQFNKLGNLMVEPAPPFLIGSNLTVYCHVTVNCEPRSKISLQLNDEVVNTWEKINCGLVKFKLSNVQTPKSKLLCKLKLDQVSQVVNGLDLFGGFPPDKPHSIICETTKSSDFIDCSWKSGREMYISTTYNVSVSRENGTQIYSIQVQRDTEIPIPRGILDNNTQYQLMIKAYNHLGASKSDPFVFCVKDIVIPETPHITQTEFENNPISAVLKWNTTEPSVHQRPYIKLCSYNGSWEVREGTELSEGLIRVDNLRPLTKYTFQMKTCYSTLRLLQASTASLITSKRSRCSKWSASVTGTSPGKGPSLQLHVWRMLSSHVIHGWWNMTVLWKPPPPGDMSGEVLQYKIFVTKDHIQELSCPGHVSQCLVQVPAEVQTVSVSAVNSYGSSPPADVPLRHAGVVGPVLGEPVPESDGSSVLVSWSWPEADHWYLASGAELLHYVVEWASVPATELQWKKLARHQNNTYITGLAAGVRYNISLYAVTTRGVSAPSSLLVYSKEQKPVSGPNMSVLVHESKQIQIQWNELPVEEQRGFITKYTLHGQMQDSNNPAFSVIVWSGSGPTQKWLKCPEGLLALQLTASNSAGEGPGGSLIFSQPADPTVSVVVVIVFIITLFITVIANLMCWRCIRERIKQKCISWGPACLVESLPKPGNSNAIRLLEQEGNEPSFSSIQSDPLLSPISLISWEERDDMYPTIHIEVSQNGSGRPTAEKPLLASDTGEMLQLEHVSYKPHIITLASEEEEVKETEEEQREVSNEEEDICPNVFRGLLRGLLSSVEVDFTDSTMGPSLSSVGGPLWPKTPEITNNLNKGLFVGKRGPESEVEVDCHFLESQQGDMMAPDTPEDTCLSHYTVEATLTDGYFPQVAVVSSTPFCDTQE